MARLEDTQPEIGMKRNRSTALCLALAAAMVGGACASISVEYDYNPAAPFGSYETYDWMPDPPVRTGDPRVANALMDERFRTAIEAELEARGLRKDTSDPDVRVGYHVALDQAVDYETLNTYWGGGWGYRGMYGGMGTTTVQAREYTVGTLIIDLFDNEAQELVWRGSGEGRVEEARSPEERQAIINDAVSRILEGYPPGG